MCISGASNLANPNEILAKFGIKVFSSQFRGFQTYLTKCLILAGVMIKILLALPDKGLFAKAKRAVNT